MVELGEEEEEEPAQGEEEEAGRRPPPLTRRSFRLLAPRRDGTAKSVLIEDRVDAPYPTAQFCGSFFVYQDTSPYAVDTHARSELFSAVLVTGTQGLRSMVLPMSKMWRPIMSLSFHIGLCFI